MLLQRWKLPALAVLSLPVQGYAAAAAFASGNGSGTGPFNDSLNGTELQGDSGAVFLMMIKVIFYLLLIIGIFLVIIKFLSKKKLRWMRGQAIRPLGGMALGQNKSIQLVEIGRSIYVVGIGDQVTLLHRIEDPEEIAHITAALTAASAEDGPSLSQLGRWASSFVKRDKGSSAEDDQEEQVVASFQDVFHSKMKHMTDRKQRIEEIVREGSDPNRKVES